MANICLVTEELAGVHGSGGIGAAFFELALLLVSNEHQVDILYCPIAKMSECEIIEIQSRFIDYAIRIDILDYEKYINAEATYERKSYSVFRELANRNELYDFIHFHDYKGLGFFAMSAKQQGLYFQNTQLVLQMHGPTRWAIEANNSFFTHEDQLKIDFMERESVRKADLIVSPSQYLVDWLRKNNFISAKQDNVFVIKNVCNELSRMYAPKVSFSKIPGRVAEIDEIIFFGRHESRKGIEIFCKAITQLNSILESRQTNVTFLGKFGKINAQDSGVYLIDATKTWCFPVNVYSSLNRNGVANYLRGRKNALVVVPSPYENSPYAVLETIILGKPLITSNNGGGPELVGGVGREWSLTQIEKTSLAEKIQDALDNGAPLVEMAESVESINIKWLNFHNQKTSLQNNKKIPRSSLKKKPKVVFGITHYERPEKLIDAITSAVRQTYENLEIVVVDDGSIKDETLLSLDAIESMLKRVNGRLIRQKNSYLGAARNTIIKNTKSDYIVFLDDDDIAFPRLVETLVTAIENSGADAVNCLNIYMDEKNRYLGITRPECFEGKVSYVPLGGPLSIAPFENTLGAATAIFRRKSLESIGGYTELYGVGHEDYELFLKIIQKGLKLEICPLPLYLYEVGRIGMLMNTSLSANFLRCFKALEFHSNADCWRDHANLSIGKKVVIDEHNRTYWVNSQLANGVLRNKLLVEEYNTSIDKLEDLIKLSELVTNVVLARAFEEEKQRIDGKYLKQQDQKQKVSLSTIFSPKKINELTPTTKPELYEIKLDLALGRTGNALKHFLNIVENRASLEQSELQLFRDILSYKISPENHDICLALKNILLQLQINPDDLEFYTLTLVQLLLVLDDKDAIGVITDQTIMIDEKDYLSLYPDIAEAVANASIPSGVLHYRYHGIKETWRFGFDRSKKLAQAISAITGRSTYFWEIKNLIGKH